jgi:hypothetical protein
MKIKFFNNDPKVNKIVKIGDNEILVENLDISSEVECTVDEYKEMLNTKEACIVIKLIDDTDLNTGNTQPVKKKVEKLIEEEKKSKK